jgi:hypothetical protein
MRPNALDLATPGKIQIDLPGVESVEDHCLDLVLIESRIVFYIKGEALKRVMSCTKPLSGRCGTR